MTTSAQPAHIHRLIAAARVRLEGAGIPADDAALDARLLAEHALGWDTVRVLTDGDTVPPAFFIDIYRALVERRTAREPLAYIVGKKEFWGLDITVTPAVLVPRPETEFIVETLLARLPDPEANAQILDVCTGSGCLAVAIANERRNCTVTATDISEDALQVARQNAVRHGVAGRVTFVRGDLLEPVEGTFDAIVANPPYVPEPERSALAPEVRDFEPALALFGGPEGLNVIERLIAAAVDHLKPGGVLLLEIGRGQDEAVAALISRNPRLRMEPFVHDLQRIPRVAVAHLV